MHNIIAEHTEEEITHATWLFAQQCQFVTSAVSYKTLPTSSLPEIAFVGRSNVGKSSLVNALVNHKKLARVSNTPGRTQQLNFFRLHDALMMVDLPGYGYAKVSKKDIAGWNALMKDYLRGRPQLKRVCILIDGRRGVKPVDKPVMALLDEHAVSYQIVLTKMDKVSADEKEKLFDDIEAMMPEHTALFPHIIVTSAHKKRGIDDLRAALASLQP